MLKKKTTLVNRHQWQNIIQQFYEVLPKFQVRLNT